MKLTILAFIPILLLATPEGKKSFPQSELTLEDLEGGCSYFRKNATECPNKHFQPNNETKPFSFVTELRDEHPFSGYLNTEHTSKNPFLFFDAKQQYEKARHNGRTYPYRLDIEGETQKGSKKYVRLQLQNHSGQNNCYASILVPSNTPIHVNLLYFALQVSCFKHFGKTAEAMEYYKDGTAKKPTDIYLDDPAFTRRNKHIQEKHQNIKDALEQDIGIKELKKIKAAATIRKRQMDERDENRKKPKKQKWA